MTDSPGTVQLGDDWWGPRGAGSTPCGLPPCCGSATRCHTMGAGACGPDVTWGLLCNGRKGVWITRILSEKGEHSEVRAGDIRGHHACHSIPEAPAESGGSGGRGLSCPRTPALPGAGAGSSCPPGPVPACRALGLLARPAPRVSSSTNTPAAAEPAGGPGEAPRGPLTCVSQTAARWALHINRHR